MVEIPLLNSGKDTSVPRRSPAPPPPARGWSVLARSLMSSSLGQLVFQISLMPHQENGYKRLKRSGRAERGREEPRCGSAAGLPFNV